jgi:hypothetical protein
MTQDHRTNSQNEQQQCLIKVMIRWLLCSVAILRAILPAAMPVRIIPLDKVPSQRRRRVSPITLTAEWGETLKKVGGLKLGSAVMVEFSAEMLKLGKATPDRFRRLLIQELRALGRSDLRVSLRGGGEAGIPVLYVIKK